MGPSNIVIQHLPVATYILNERDHVLLKVIFVDTGWNKLLTFFYCDIYFNLIIFVSEIRSLFKIPMFWYISGRSVLI